MARRYDKRTLVPGAPPELVASRRRKMWAAIRELKVFTVRELALKTGEEISYTSPIIRSYEKAGYLAQDGFAQRDVPHKKQALVFRLIRDVGRIPPLGIANNTKQIGEDQIWRALKIKSGATADDLAALATNANYTVSKATALRYVSTLVKAGYVAERDGCYFLKSAGNTGPQAPAVISCKTVYDPNLEAVVWRETPDE